MSRRSRRILAIDQGTTSTRAVLVDGRGRPGASARRELPQSYPGPGRVEHDPERIREDALWACREAMRRGGVEPAEVAAIGITNQRETTVLWERSTGRPVHPALVWQDRRTAEICSRLREQGHEPGIRRKTGLLLDPYFSATKLAWLLDHVDGARAAAERGDLAFGTVDSWLLWNLTGGRAHRTDATNAARTMLYDIHRGEWDEELLELFGVPRPVLPEVLDCSARFGETDPDLLGRSIPITGMAGDQHAATFGQTAFDRGTAKATYGTGAFLLLNTGTEAPDPEGRLLTTVAWQREGEATYAVEGSIFSAGSAVQWLRDELGVIDEVAESEELAARARDDDGTYLVPAFTGLGAPHWDADARGALVGLTRDSGAEEIARAALASVAYQTRDLVDAMVGEAAITPDRLRVDGGLSRNEWAMGFLSDMLDLPVERPAVTETTALGAGYLAGLEVGFFGGTDELREHWSLDRRWEPGVGADRRRELLEGWRRAVSRVLTSEGA